MLNQIEVTGNPPSNLLFTHCEIWTRGKHQKMANKAISSHSKAILGFTLITFHHQGENAVQTK